MSKYVRNEKYICRKIVDNIMLFPADENIRFQGGIALNNVAYYVWEILEKEKTLEEISTLVAEKFMVNAHDILPDITDFIGQFLELRVVNVCV